MSQTEPLRESSSVSSKFRIFYSKRTMSHDNIFNINIMHIQAKILRTFYIFLFQEISKEYCSDLIKSGNFNYCSCFTVSKTN